MCRGPTHVYWARNDSLYAGLEYKGLRLGLSKDLGWYKDAGGMRIGLGLGDLVDHVLVKKVIVQLNGPFLFQGKSPHFTNRGPVQDAIAVIFRATRKWQSFSVGSTVVKTQCKILCLDPSGASGVETPFSFYPHLLEQLMDLDQKILVPFVFRR